MSYVQILQYKNTIDLLINFIHLEMRIHFYHIFIKPKEIKIFSF